MLFSCALLSAYGGIRISSEPFISGDTFRSICDFIYDETDKSFNPKDVKRGNLIFVNADVLGAFFRDKHPKIRNKYILITHNSVFSVPGRYSKYLNDSKIIMWFGKNADGRRHKKLCPIPLGLANRNWPHGSIEIVKEAMQKAKSTEKEYFCYLNIKIETYPKERVGVWNLFKDQPYVTKVEKTDYKTYLGHLAKSQFVISPRGNGVDCHRHWEAIYMGAIPIFKTSGLDRLYDGLPVLIVKDWNEVTEEFLRKKYDEIKRRPVAWEKMYFPYWKSKIDKYRKK